MRMTVDSPSHPAAEDRRSAVTALVVHEEEIVRFGWRLTLGRQPWVRRCIAAGTKAEALALAHRYSPTVAILDLDAGHERAADTISALHVAAPGLAVLLVAGSAAISAKAASLMGATGVAPKALAAEDLANAVRAVSSGERLFAIPSPVGAHWLSDREKEVLGLMASGATNREIAAMLHVSAETIKRHAAAIFRKLAVRNRTEAAQRGRELGLAMPAPLRQHAVC